MPYSVKSTVPLFLFSAVEGSRRIVELMKAKHTTGKMIEIDYKQDEKGNQNVEVIIHSFILVGNVSYFFEISNFFIPDDEEVWKKHSIEDLPDVVNSEDKRTDTMSVYVKIEEPDIFLVTDIGNEDSDALMLNTEVQFQYLSSPGQNSMVMLKNLYNLLFCLYIGYFSLVSVIVKRLVRHLQPSLPYFLI